MNTGDNAAAAESKNPDSTKEEVKQANAPSESKADTSPNEESKVASSATEEPPKANIEESKKLYVGNLKPGVTNQALFDHFSNKGFSVISASVKVSANDILNVFGFIVFSSAADTEKALETLNDTELQGKKMRLMKWNPGSFIRDRETANIYVKDLDLSITQKELSEKFSVFGNILSVKLETYSDGTSKGFGYVQFENSDEANKAINELNNTTWKDKTITVCTFKKRGAREEQRSLKNNLYCRNFPTTYTEDDLRALFDKFGNITSLAVKPHLNDKKQGFVCFETGEQAHAAINELNGTRLEGCSEDLLVTELLKKSERLEENKKNFRKIKDDNLLSSLSSN